MRCWAIVIGIDEYDSDSLNLNAAASDALKFCAWVTAKDGGNVPKNHLKLLLGRAADDPGDGTPVPTKDNIVTAITEVVTAAEAEDDADQLYFYFSGHGITARVSNRDEGALVTPGFSVHHPDHSLAIRSLTEYFETTPFKDQFFFFDACRDIPWENETREFEIGRWPIPRKRDPGKQPVQQFILYATSPGLKAAESAWGGAFTGVLMDALNGADTAKAWSWERNSYEVRWEGLATYINAIMSERTQQTQPPPSASLEDVPFQIPQDTGSRGVANRDRNALLVSFPEGHFPSVELTVEFELDPPYERADMRVIDAIAQPVKNARDVGPGRQTFTLPPKTYAVEAVTTDKRVGVVKSPINLYKAKLVELLPPEAPSPGRVEESIGPEDPDRVSPAESVGTIAIEASDRRALAEIRDEAGKVVSVTGSGESKELPPGFYRVSPFGPERTGKEKGVILRAGQRETVPLTLPPEPEDVAVLAEALGVEDSAAWAQASTHVAAAVGKALQGSEEVWRALGLKAPPERQPGIAFLAVAGEGNAAAVEDLSVRIWPTGSQIPNCVTHLAPSAAGVAAVIVEAHEAETHWLAVEPPHGGATVVALPVMPGRLATVVAQVDTDRPRAYQFHPMAGEHESSTVERLLQIEYLERLLQSGRLDGADALAKKLAQAAAEDPFAGCVAGYVLLRLGCHKELETLTSTITVAAPKLSDAHILRGEFEAAAHRPEAARQAFIDAVNAGIPAFGEGLTRLLEGLRANGFVHPRGELVRHIFQRHVRGSMWAAFLPRRELEAGALAISGVDVGLEG